MRYCKKCGERGGPLSWILHTCDPREVAAIGELCDQLGEEE